MVQQLLPLTFGLDVVRRSVDQLAAKQEQLTQNIAVLQATVEEDVRQKVSSTPPPPTLQAASSSPKRGHDHAAIVNAGSIAETRYFSF
jgi:cell division septum initiation protein DivIVA